MVGEHPDRNIIALGIRQPWAELIVRGIKTIEVRSLNTRCRDTIYIYASKKLAEIPAAEAAARKFGIDVDMLPRGLIVGTADIVDSIPCSPHDATAACVSRAYLQNQFAWRLENAQQFSQPITVRFLPYGVWFYPFKRRNADRRATKQ